MGCVVPIVVPDIEVGAGCTPYSEPMAIVQIEKGPGQALISWPAPGMERSAKAVQANRGQLPEAAV